MSRPAAARFGHTAGLKLKLTQITGYRHIKVTTEIGTKADRSSARACSGRASAPRAPRTPHPCRGGDAVRLAPLRAPLSHTLGDEGLREALSEARSRPKRAATSWSQMTYLLHRIAANIVREHRDGMRGLPEERGACDHGCEARAHLESHLARLRSWETLSGAKRGPAGAAIASPSCPASATSTATHGGTISAMAKLAPEGLSAMVIGHVPPWCQRPSAQGSAGEWRSAKSVKRQVRMTNWIGVEAKRRSRGGPGAGQQPPTASANLVAETATL